MPTWQLYAWALHLTWFVFVFAFGACVGSLVNVLVYRLPRGIGVVTPPSACPACGTRLTFRENIPILGWLLLRGRCRYCRAPISPEYPLVEAFVAVLFASFYVLWFMVERRTTSAGLDVASIRPEWAMNGTPVTVPLFLMVLGLLGSLTAMTLVDAKTFTIPLVLAWIPAIVGLLAHVGTAVYVQHTAGRLAYTAPGFNWALPTPVEIDPVTRRWTGGWPATIAAIGAVAGLGLGNLLVWTGLIRRSFADFADWERSTAASATGADTDAGSQTRPSGGQEPRDADRPADTWIQYPHARREMVRELAFLAPCVGLAMLGWYAGRWWAPSEPAPLWVTVLGGVLIGYIVGGGVVWGVRIIGSLGFGKEAMGLGDVHLMAGVGACLGWIDATLAFFLAAFVGLSITVIQFVVAGSARRTMPYGPSLAIAAILVILGKPAIEWGLTRLLRFPVNIP